MNFLCLDVGSSSVKAGIVRKGRALGKIARAPLTTHFDGVRAEVDPTQVLRAITRVIRTLGPRARHADVIALAVMSPAWLAMDRSGKPLTPLITHQDRRSVEIALQLEQRVGRNRYLSIAGNRPVPGGISATTLAWFNAHHPSIMRSADLVGHLNTFLHRHLTGRRVIDSSNASFTGLYETIRQRTWSTELCHAAGADLAKLPEIFDSNIIAGRITDSAASEFGLRAGTPMLAGMIDTGAAMLLAPARPGQLLNVSGSTDVLALCVKNPLPDERLITRALGLRGLWLSVATIAAAGSAIAWMKDQFFADLTAAKFHKLISRLAPTAAQSKVHFDPYLAGDRMTIEQKQAAFSGLTLATTREDMLAAVIDSLAKASAARIPLLQSRDTPIYRRVLISGGAAAGMQKILYRDWSNRWLFHTEPEATLRGLSMLTPRLP